MPNLANLTSPQIQYPVIELDNLATCNFGITLPIFNFLFIILFIIFYLRHDD